MLKLIVALFFLFTGHQALAIQCKGSSKSVCKRNDSVCSWASGPKITDHCRSKPGKAKNRSTASKKSTKKKEKKNKKAKKSKEKKKDKDKKADKKKKKKKKKKAKKKK